MEAEDLIFDDCSERQVVEKFSKLFPNISVAILAQTFVIEPIPVCSLAIRLRKEGVRI